MPDPESDRLWQVTERRVGAALDGPADPPRRALVFETEGCFRVVHAYPADWAAQPDEVLLGLAADPLRRAGHGAPNGAPNGAPAPGAEEP